VNKKQRREAKKALAAVGKGPVNGEAKSPTPKAAAVKKAGALPELPRMPKGKRSRKARPTQPCACGCGTPTTGIWAPGHDARARGWALRITRGMIKMSDVPANEQAGAKLMLKAAKDQAATPATATPKAAAKKASTGKTNGQAGQPTQALVPVPEQVTEPEPDKIA
jgi:hypothetical protein